MTKKEYKAHKVAWAKALSEGRVVRYSDGMSFKSFLTAAEADAFVTTLVCNGLRGAVVKVG